MDLRKLEDGVQRMKSREQTEGKQFVLSVSHMGLLQKHMEEEMR